MEYSLYDIDNACAEKLICFKSVIEFIRHQVIRIGYGCQQVNQSPNQDDDHQVEKKGFH